MDEKVAFFYSNKHWPEVFGLLDNHMYLLQQTNRNREADELLNRLGD
jgi:hypothetical protein